MYVQGCVASCKVLALAAAAQQPARQAVCTDVTPDAATLLLPHRAAVVPRVVAAGCVAVCACLPTLPQLLLTAGDGPEALLPCCVPYLQLHPLIVQENLFDLEVNPARTATAYTAM
jgi:hypothetical protein